jgi:hypothetical protein
VRSSLAVGVALALMATGCGSTGARPGTGTASADAPPFAEKAPSESGSPREGGQAVRSPQEPSRSPVAPRASPAAAVRQALAGGAEAACRDYVTPRYVSAAYGSPSACLAAQRSGAAAQSVSIRGVRVSGAGARALAVPNGGVSDGETLHMTLVAHGGRWRVDSVKAHVAVGP